MIYKISHIASLLAKQHTLTQSVLHAIKGTGPQGLIMKSDILDFTCGRIKLNTPTQVDSGIRERA